MHFDAFVHEREGAQDVGEFGFGQAVEAGGEGVDLGAEVQRA